MSSVIDTDVLVVGAGPAGASAGLFLAKHGIKTLVIARHRGTAETPRAHIVNQRTMEVMRDVGLEDACVALASPSSLIAHSFFLRSMVGEELARAWAWGNDPSRKGDYELASPCAMCDLPQTRLEPVLVTEASRLGAHVRFGWELRTFSQDKSGVTAEIIDRLSDDVITVRAKYMIGADGARSRVVEQLGLPLVGQHGLGNAFNVLCEIDLSEYVAHRHASLYSVIQPGSSYWAPVAVFRMVRAWDQWLIGLIVPQAAGKPEPRLQDFEERVRALVGHATLPFRILSTSMWTINDVFAERYTEERVFCMGDAVHRHPPANGLGSNTCVQDAFNLAWKLAFVLKGKANARLLESYDAERQPVGRQIVARANRSQMQNYKVWDLLGGGTRTEVAPDSRTAIFDTKDGRALLRQEIENMQYTYHAHGVEMTRRYHSNAVVSDGRTPVLTNRDPELYYHPSTTPGASLPHAWLGHRLPGPAMSTLDLAGKQRFTLITGHGGEAWRDVARTVSEKMGVDIPVASIGPYLDYEDLYGTWRELSEVDESGCVLVRPDLIVGWRSYSLPEDPLRALDTAMRQILGYSTH
jgi:2,4-dichlorophenol 6-monooxygenase